MAELTKTCWTCGREINVDLTLCVYCGVDPDDEPVHPDPSPDPDSLPDPEAPDPEALEIVLAGVRIRVQVDESVVLGRQGDDEIAGACAAFDNVSRMHATVSARTGGVVEVRDLDSLNGTFVGTQRLAPNVHRLLDLPTTIRLARNCYVNIQIARD